MNKLKQFGKVYNDLIFGKEIVHFEEKLLLSCAFYVAIFQIVSFIFNILLKLKTAIIYASIVGFFIFLILYLTFRFYSRSTIMYHISGIVMLLFLDLVWFVNYGSEGPSPMFFLVLYSFMILLFRKKHYFYITLITLINLIGLFIFETYFYEYLSDYPDRHTRLSDVFSGFILSILILLSFLSVIKQNYFSESERAKKSDQLKSAFLANMSHEIRTPLNAIVGFSSLIAESDQDMNDEDKKMYREQVLSNSDYLLNLIEDIIDVSKIESNQLTLKVQPIDVVPLIRQLIQTFSITVPEGKNVSIISNIRAEKLIVMTDRLRLEQILRNLLANALKFTDKGSIEVDCRRENSFFVFSVKDTGTGIQKENHQIIFDRFIKIDNNKQHLYRGTGIGLFLSKQLVEMFGGKIWVESEPGKGSDFRFSIPA